MFFNSLFIVLLFYESNPHTRGKTTDIALKMTKLKPAFFG